MHVPKKVTATAALVAALLLVQVGSLSAQVPRTSENTRVGASPAAARGRDIPGLTSNPTNANHLVAVDTNVLAGRCEYNVTFDAGRTWAGGVLTAQPKAGEPAFPAADAQFPDVLCNAGNAADGSVAFGTGQNVYTTFATRRSSSEGFSVVVPRSTDGGRTFLPGVVAMGPAPGTTSPSYSRPELAVQPGAGANGADRIYVAANRSPQTGAGSRVVVTVSQDSGATWGAPVVVANENSVEASQPVVGPDNAVYVAWRTSSSVPAGFVRMSKSTDMGATWTTTNVAPVRGYGPDAAGSTFNGSTFPRIAVDPRGPATTPATLYVVYMQGPSPQNGPGVTPGPALRAAGGVRAQDHFIHPDADVAFVRSTDGARTFSAPVRVNDDPGGKGEPGVGPAQRHPRVAVAPNGRVDVVWQDRRHGYRSPTNSHLGNGEARFGDTYYAFSRNQGLAFSANRRVSDKSQNLDVGLDLRGGVYWNYSPALVSLSDQALFAWQDSREGNIENGNEDIYMSRLRVDVPLIEAPPKQMLPPGPNTADSVALSKLAYQAGPEAVLNPGAAAFTNRAVSRVVVVNETDVPGALAGAVLSRAHLGPVLLSPASTLPAAVKAEVDRMSPIAAYVIGSEASLSAGVISALVDAGVPEDRIVRLSDPNPAVTARLIAENSPRRGTEAVIVNPASPESPAVSGLAATLRLPVLFADQGSVPPATSEALRTLGITKTLVVGSPTALSSAVDAQLAAEGRNPTRVGGTNVQTTSEAVVRESLNRGLPRNIVFSTATDNPIEAAVIGSSVARVGGLELLVPPNVAASAAGATSLRATAVDDTALQASLLRLGLTVDKVVVAQGTGLAPPEAGAAAPTAPTGPVAQPAAAAPAPAATPFDNSGATGARRPGSGSRLPITGIGIGLLVGLALAAIGTGRVLQQRRRRNGEAVG